MPAKIGTHGEESEDAGIVGDYRPASGQFCGGRAPQAFGDACRPRSFRCLELSYPEMPEKQYFTHRRGRVGLCAPDRIFCAIGRKGRGNCSISSVVRAGADAIPARTFCFCDGSTLCGTEEGYTLAGVRAALLRGQSPAHGEHRCGGPEKGIETDCGFVMMFSRDVAQLGSAPAWGAGGRRFKSSRPDQMEGGEGACEF